MAKTLFTDKEIRVIVETLGRKLQVSINRAGNIKIVNNDEPNSRSWFGRTYHGFWVLYKHDNGTYLWRRHNGGGYCYPLNMKGRKFKGPVYKHRNCRTGRLEYWGYKPYNIEMSEFTSFEDAVNYFMNYLKRYRGIKL